MKLRLLITKKCNRTCKGCCNKDWDLDALQPCDFTKQYSEIMLTGGEPMLNPGAVQRCAELIKTLQPQAKVYVYSADIRPSYWRALLQTADGLTITLHNRQDQNDFLNWVGTGNFGYNGTKSLRLNVFGKFSRKAEFINWKIKDGIKWIKNCPLPVDEDFRKLILF